MLGWPLHITNVIIGALVILYTVSGGTRAVSQTQTLQMVVMLSGMAAAFVFVLRALPSDVGLSDALHLAGSLGKMQLVDYSARMDTRYTLWSGLAGGLFIALAYFGTDQSQVQRYLGAARWPRAGWACSSTAWSRSRCRSASWLWADGLRFYQFHEPPLFFHEAELRRAEATAQGPSSVSQPPPTTATSSRSRRACRASLPPASEATTRPWPRPRPRWPKAMPREPGLRQQAKAAIKARPAAAETKDADYVFLRFVTTHFPPASWAC